MLFTKGAESAILPFATGGEIEKTRLHVDEFALVRTMFYVYFISEHCQAAFAVTAILRIHSVGSGKDVCCSRSNFLKMCRQPLVKGVTDLFPTLDKEHIF